MCPILTDLGKSSGAIILLSMLIMLGQIRECVVKSNCYWNGLGRVIVNSSNPFVSKRLVRNDHFTGRGSIYCV